MRSYDWETKPLRLEDVEKIIASVPGFRASWEAFVQQYAGEPSLPWYLGMADLAHYVVDQYEKGTTDEFSNLFATIENLLEIPNPQLKDLITVGLFEDIQNIASHRNFGVEVFQRWLGPRSLPIWQEVEAFWERVGERTKNHPFKNTFDAEQALSQVQNPALRKIIESSYRRKISGV